jgi:biopolymer transport protein ExbB
MDSTRIFDALDTYFAQGGFIMWPLVVSTVLLWYALGYRMFTLQRGGQQSVYTLIENYAKRGDKVPPSGIVYTACALGVKLAKRTQTGLRPVLDDAFGTFDRDLSRGKMVIGALVAAAPLLGLLGTVTGMIETFDSMADMSFYTQSGGIAGGIAEALFTTQMGLVVAVPGVIIGRLLDARQTRLADELTRIKDILCADSERMSRTEAASTLV